MHRYSTSRAVTMLTLSDLRPTLIARPVRLEPLTEHHRAGLALAADPAEIWEHMPSSASGDGFDAWFDQALELALAGREAVWAVRTSADGALVGSTRYLAIEPAHRRLEVGHTWYSPRVWRARSIPPASSPCCATPSSRWASTGSS